MRVKFPDFFYFESLIYSYRDVLLPFVVVVMLLDI